MTAAQVEAASLLAEAWETSHAFTYRHGWVDGHRVGYAVGFNEADRTWHLVFGIATGVFAAPTTAEVEAARQLPREFCGEGRCRFTTPCNACFFVAERARRGEWLGHRRGWAR